MAGINGLVTNVSGRKLMGLPFGLTGGQVAGGIGALANFFIGDNANDSATGAQIQAMQDAMSAYDEAVNEAMGLIAQGNAEAAAHIMQQSKLAIGDLLRGERLGVEALEKFWAIADSKLEPFRKHGLFAQREIASMLGIPNDKGQIVPFNTEKLRNTPGYKFQLSEQLTAINNKAVAGKGAFAGSTLEAAREGARNHADQYFNTRVGQLQGEANRGFNAGSVLAQLAGRVGSDQARVHSTTGGNLANTRMATGTALGNLAGNTATNMANLTESKGSQMADMLMLMGLADANSTGANASNWTNLINGLTKPVGSILDSIIPGANAVTGTPPWMINTGGGPQQQQGVTYAADANPYVTLPWLKPGNELTAFGQTPIGQGWYESSSGNLSKMNSTGMNSAARAIASLLSGNFGGVMTGLGGMANNTKTLGGWSNNPLGDEESDNDSDWGQY